MYVYGKNVAIETLKKAKDGDIVQFTSDFKKFTGNIKNSDFKLSMNGATVNCDTFTLSVSDKDITINPSQILINNSSSINLSGDIKNYIKNPVFNFNVDGKIIIGTEQLKQLKDMFEEIIIYSIACCVSVVIANLFLIADSKKRVAHKISRN